MGVFSTAGELVGSIAGSVARATAGAAWFGTKAVFNGRNARAVAGVAARETAPAAARLGSMGARAGAAALSTAAGAATMAAETALGAGALAYRAARWVGGGRITQAREELFTVGGRAIHAPRFTSRFEDSLVAGALGLAGVAGAVDYGMRNLPKQGWGVTQSVMTGQMEIENDRFLGATGSLTLAMHKARFGRGGMPTMDDTTVLPVENRMHVMGHLADDFVLAGARMLR